MNMPTAPDGVCSLGIGKYRVYLLTGSDRSVGKRKEWVGFKQLLFFYGPGLEIELFS